MQIIVPHEMADFDALAAAVAAQKLHPEAKIVLGRRLGREVKTYLALHKDRFPAVRVDEVDQSEVTGLVLVDFRRRARMGDWQELLERIDRGEVSVAVYDHHPASDDDLDGELVVVEPVGSATTLMVEEMRSRRLSVDVEEATLFALGIHADTGSLTYATSTGRDARALAWLYDHGVNLRVLTRYLEPPFSAGQRQALLALLEAVEIEQVAGLSVAFAAVSLGDTVDDLAEVTTEGLELLGSAALFAAYESRGKVHLIARSRSRLIDVASFVAPMGGGGHAPAAAGVVKDRNAAAVVAELRQALFAAPPRARTVADLMSSPVRTVPHDLPLVDLAESLETWQHTGAPVLRDGKLSGIVSRRDLERARADDRLGLPVSSCMTHKVVTTAPDASLEEALAAMERHDVGRLPVLKGERLVGIVTRSDLLAVLYAARKAE